jgi:hypothetical protein
MAMFSETRLKPYMRFCIPSYDFYRTGHEDGRKGETAVAVKRGIPHTCVDLPPLLPVEAPGVCMLIGNTEMFLAALYKSAKTVE